MLPKSPLGRALSFGPACGLPAGLKWAPADIASGAEQSPFSWTCSPCTPGGAFSTSTTILTPRPSTSVNLAVPVTVDPLLGWIVALASAAIAAGPAAAAKSRDPTAATIFDELHALFTLSSLPASPPSASRDANDGRHGHLSHLLCRCRRRATRDIADVCRDIGS